MYLAIPESFFFFCATGAGAGASATGAGNAKPQRLQYFCVELFSAEQFVQVMVDILLISIAESDLQPEFGFNHRHSWWRNAVSLSNNYRVGLKIGKDLNSVFKAFARAANKMIYYEHLGFVNLKMHHETPKFEEWIQESECCGGPSTRVRLPSRWRIEGRRIFKEQMLVHRKLFKFVGREGSCAWSPFSFFLSFWRSKKKEKSWLSRIHTFVNCL